MRWSFKIRNPQEPSSQRLDTNTRERQHHAEQGVRVCNRDNLNKKLYLFDILGTSIVNTDLHLLLAIDIWVIVDVVLAETRNMTS